jgi:hypothetical protein
MPATKVVIEVRPEDVQSVIRLARLAIDQGKAGLDDEDSEAVASIGALRHALEKADK